MEVTTAAGAGTFVTAEVPLSIAAAVDAAGAAVLPAASQYVIAGSGFTANATQVLLGTVPLQAAGGAPGPGEFSVDPAGTAITLVPRGAAQRDLSSPGPCRRHRVRPGPRAGHTMTASSEGAEPSWLTDVRLRVARRFLWLRALWAASGQPGDDVMAISHSEVDRTLTRRRAHGRGAPVLPGSAQAAGLSAAIDRLADFPPDPRWDHLVTTLGLTPQDANLLALALAAHAVPGMRRVFGYLQDDTAAADASIGLAAVL